METMDRMVQLAQTDLKYHLRLQEFQYLQDVVKRLGVDGQSSDEDDMQVDEDTSISVFVVKECVWRSKHMTAYMKVIDKLKENFLKGVGGANPTPRLRGYRQQSTIPVCGLPRTMYNAEWLAQKEKESPEWVKACLNVSDQEFELLEIVLD
jgi:hypothetical protein